MKYVIDATQWYHGAMPSVITTFPTFYDTFDKAYSEVKPIVVRQGDRERYMIHGRVYDAYDIRPVEDF